VVRDLDGAAAGTGLRRNRHQAYSANPVRQAAPVAAVPRDARLRRERGWHDAPRAGAGHRPPAACPEQNPLGCRACSSEGEVLANAQRGRRPLPVPDRR